MSTFTTSVEPPNADSSVFRSASPSPPLGNTSWIVNLASMSVEAIPSPIEMAATTAMYGIGRRVTELPSAAAIGPTRGIASATRVGRFRVPLDSRRRSRIARAAGISVSITIRLMPTPSPATIPKSAIAGIGESSCANRLPIVVTAARESGTITIRMLARSASVTGRSPARCSR